MHKKVLLLTLILLLSYNAFWAAETKLSTELWSRYTYERVADTTKKSVFSLERGYFRVEPTFTDKIKGRFNLDFFSSDKYTDGAGIKLKYAYVEFNEVIPIPESKLVFGLDKNYFGTVYDWEYVTIEKALEDKEKVASSADYGIFFTGFIPKGFGEYALSLINGEGYSKAGSKVNVNPAPVVNLRIIPLPGVSLGSSLLYEKAGFLDTIKTAYDKRMLYAGVARFAFRPIDAWFEYLVRDSAKTKSQGFMIMPILRLVKPLELVFRYDRWDPNTSKEKDAYSTLIGGFNWNILFDSQGLPTLFV
ncbi:MAG: hypothetical protein ABIK93_10045, partial [candidate division WOR-3 bacterium]